MRVVQCFFLRQTFRPIYILKMLVASMMQWKAIFPEDEGALYVDLDSWKIVESILEENALKIPWKSVVIQDYKERVPQFQAYHDATRFAVCLDQKESYVFLDPDIFVFPEFKTKELLKAREDVETATEDNRFYTYTRFRAWSPILNLQRDLPGSVRSILNYWDGTVEPTMLNTGFFIVTPGLGQKLSQEVLKVQLEFYRTGIYSPAKHEFSSSIVPLLYMNSVNIPCRLIPSPGLIHTYQNLDVAFNIVPPLSSRERDFYGSDFDREHRLAFYENFCSYVFYEGRASLIDFANVRKELANGKRRLNLV